MDEPTNEEVRCAIVADLHNAKQALRNRYITIKRNTLAFVESQERRLQLLYLSGFVTTNVRTIEELNQADIASIEAEVKQFEQELSAFDVKHPETYESHKYLVGNTPNHAYAPIRAGHIGEPGTDWSVFK